MPKQTFINLDSIKRAHFTHVFLIAFTNQNYDETSISDVLKRNGFAKGSFYQYFEHKLDLFNYLISHASESKLKYIKTIDRAAFTDFWEYWRATYKAGIDFDANEPVQSNFLYQLMKNMQTPSLQPLFINYRDAALTYFEQLVEKEIELGHFRADLPPNFMAHFIYEISTQFFTYYQLKNATIFEHHIKKGLPIFYTDDCKTTFLELLDQNITLMKSALTKVN